MAWRMSIDHRTHFVYAAKVAASYNEARLTPKTTKLQTTLESRLDVDLPAHVSRYQDYWGTVVHAFDVHVAHTEMLVRGRSVVERTSASMTSASIATGGRGADSDREVAGADWAELDDADVVDQYCEYLAPSRWVPDDPDVTAVGVALRMDAPTPADALTGAVEWVRSQLQYEAGTTTVSTSAVEAWHKGSGVCQDFTHLSLAVLRAAGIPARYVSGYLHPDIAPAVGDVAVGQSHAWIEAWIGHWAASDPTNGSPVAERHVLVAQGRDYGDVTPLKGIFGGGPTQHSEVTVELTRLA